MLRVITPVLIVLIGFFGALDIVFPISEGSRAFSADGFGVVIIACAVILLCVIGYLFFLKNRETGSNADEAEANALRKQKLKAGLQRGWKRPE